MKTTASILILLDTAADAIHCKSVCQLVAAEALCGVTSPAAHRLVITEALVALIEIQDLLERVASGGEVNQEDK